MPSNSWYAIHRKVGRKTLEFAADRARRDLIKQACAALAVTAVSPAVQSITRSSHPRRNAWRLTEAGDAVADGYLRRRLELSYRRLQEPYFQWEQISKLNIEEFPGDALGRAINGLTFLGQGLRTGQSANLKEIIERLPQLRNRDGYLGRELPADRADEDSVAGHNGLLCGLVEYYRWTHDPAALRWLRDIRDSLFVPLHASLAHYRQGVNVPETIQWRLSTFDIGQLFLTLDGLTRAYEVVPSPSFKAVIDAMIDRYRSLDMVSISAQTHSMLSATRGIVRWYGLHGRAEDLALAEKRFGQYRQLATTETYENYNWFNRPSHSEGCALVDSFELATDLWSVTEKAGYLEDAHLILFNALLPGQCLNGGFGVGACVGAPDQDGKTIESTATHSEAPWCCSMRGAEGLVYVTRASHFTRGDTVVLPFYNSVRSTLRFDDGTCEIEQRSEYPHTGHLEMTVLSSGVKAQKRVRMYMPPWVERRSVALSVDGAERQFQFDGAFAEVPLKLARGTTLQLRFEQSESPIGLVETARSPGWQRFRRGPLLLGLATSDSPVLPGNGGSGFAVRLRPIFDVLDPLTGRDETIQVLFPIPGSAVARAQSQMPLSDPIQASLASDVVPLAVVSYRQAPEDPRALGLFTALRAQSTVFDAFVWEQPQPVSQVVIEWPQSAQTPAPADVVLRWLPAGAVAATHRPPADVNRGLREKKGPGVIGDGKRWVFTLSRELGQGAIDNIALLGPKGSAIGAAPERIYILTR